MSTTETVAEMRGRMDAEAWMAEYPDLADWKQNVAYSDEDDVLLDSMPVKLVPGYLGIEMVRDDDGDLAIDLPAVSEALHQYALAWQGAIIAAIRAMESN